MKLDWGNVLKFADEREYYEVLGFLAKDEEYIRVYTESNDKSGAWAPQGRLLLRNVDISSLPEPLMKAFETSLDGRISETKYETISFSFVCHFFCCSHRPSINLFYTAISPFK